MARLSCRHCITVSLFICVSIFRAKLLFSPPPCVKKRIYHSLHWSASNKQKKGGKKQISSSPRVHVLINGAAPKTAPPAPLLTEGNLSSWINPSYQYVWVWQLWRQDSSSSRARGVDSVWTWRLLHQHLEDLGRHTGAPHLTVVVLAGLMCEAAVLYRHSVRFSVCVVLPLAAFFFIFHLYLHPIMAGTDRRCPVIPKLPNDQKQVS